MRVLTATRNVDPLTLTTRLLLAGFSACAAIIGAAVVLVLGARLVYAGEALPGVRAAGIDLTGMSSAEIELTLDKAFTYPQTGLILLHDGNRNWTARPQDLGVVIDIPAMAEQALAVGRRGDLLERVQDQASAWAGGQSLAPIVLVDQRVGAAFLQRIAAQIDQPEVEASLTVHGVEVEVHPGQIGRRLDIDATLDAMGPSFARLYDADVPLVVRESPPQVLDVTQQAALARGILSQALTLTAEGAGPWTFDPPSLATMLRFNRVSDAVGTHIEVGLDPQALAAFLEPLVSTLERKPENARFIFNDDTRQLDLLREAVIGRDLDVPATIQAINAGVVAGQHEIPLVFDTTNPPVLSDAKGADLGITELVVDAKTYFGGSSPERIQNIKTASAAFHGLLVAPGQTLSMADVLGDISLDNGYAEALIIFGDRTIQGVGGGVCQVSTTLFRAVFFGGYQIDQRYPHAYRVGYYEQGPGSPGPGLDATVFAPKVDFQFTNDTQYWLLMETYVYGSTLEWKFYSTKDGRAVTWNSTGPTDVVNAPEPLYKENSDLPEGKIKQVDWAADGANVVVTRTVTRNGEVLHHDVIKTHYLPWRAIYEYGPGTKLPKGAKTE
jgi:vancomycin resistance protein YoaR